MSARDNHVIGVMSRCESNESRSLVTSRKYLRKIRLVKKRQDSGAFLLTTELFERANQISCGECASPHLNLDSVCVCVCVCMCRRVHE